MRSFDWKNIYRASAAGLAVALAQISTTPIQAADYDVGSIHITAPWARATPKGASNSHFGDRCYSTRHSYRRRSRRHDAHGQALTELADGSIHPQC